MTSQTIVAGEKSRTTAALCIQCGEKLTEETEAYQFSSMCFDCWTDDSFWDAND